MMKPTSRTVTYGNYNNARSYHRRYLQIRHTHLHTSVNRHFLGKPGQPAIFFFRSFCRKARTINYAGFLSG